MSSRGENFLYEKEGTSLLYKLSSPISSSMVSLLMATNASKKLFRDFLGEGINKRNHDVDKTSLVASTPTPAKRVIILHFPHVPNGLKCSDENHNYLNRSTFLLPKFPRHRPPSTTSFNTAFQFSK